MKFRIIDRTTGKEPSSGVIDHIGRDLYDIDQFAVCEDGNIVLLDDCGRVAYCDPGRFKAEELPLPGAKDKAIINHLYLLFASYMAFDDVDTTQALKVAIDAIKGKPKLINSLRDYQIEWLITHNDIKLTPELEERLIQFIIDTTESFINTELEKGD